MAHTISDWPRPASPATKTPGDAWSEGRVAARRCRARRAPRRAARRSRPRSGPVKPMASRTSCGRDLALGALDPAKRPSTSSTSTSRSARTCPPLVAEELLGADGVDPLAALLVRAWRPGRSSGRSATAGAPARSSRRPRHDLELGDRCARPAGGRCPRQSAPVSPPPMMTTCLPCAVIGGRSTRARQRTWLAAAGTPSPDGRRRARARAPAGRGRAVAPTASTTAS